ncbi:MAG: esterase-like activity of phytase family protein [Holophagales bacterium]|nr:esterase-like activity of phytase family protein [Holophagales bacterium]
MRSSALPRIPAHLPVLAILAGLFAAPVSGSAPPESSITGLSYVGRTVLTRDLEFERTRIGGSLGPGLGRDVEVLLGDLGRQGPARPRSRLPLPNRPEYSRDDQGPVGAGRYHRRDARAERRQGKALRSNFDRHRGNRHRPRRIPRFDGSDQQPADPGRDRRARTGWAPAPGAFAPTPVSLRKRPGPRDNLGFEGLAPTRDGRYLFAGIENALAQDGPVAGVGTASPSRILRFDLEKKGPPAEFAYLVDAVSPVPANKAAFSVNGLSDLLPLDGNRLLVLERQFVEGVGNAAHIYDVSLEGASDVSALDSLEGASFVPASKTLLLDLTETGIPLENFEGMAFGPPLPDGRGTLVLVSDDNFNPAQEATTFLVFAVERGTMSVARIQGAGHRSPLEGSWVFGVSGVVTAIDRDTRNPGFWIESSRPDDNPATSEGLFVLFSGALSLSPGQTVSVSGRVEEFAQPKSLSVTRLKATTVAPIEGEPPLPPPVQLFTERRIPSAIDNDGLTLFDPSSGAIDFWESLEGMRVEVPGGTVVGPSSSRGDLVVGPTALRRFPHRGGRRPPSEAGPSLDRVLVGKRLAGEMPGVDVGARAQARYGESSITPSGTTGSGRFAPLAVEAEGRGCDAASTFAATAAT